MKEPYLINLRLQFFKSLRPNNLFVSTSVELNMFDLWRAIHAIVKLM